MGKNGKFGKDYGKVVGKDSKSRPGWKGPAYTKKQDPKPKVTTEASDIVDTEPLVPSKLQQLLLNIFKDTFHDLLTSDTLRSTLQEVKTALYERDFQHAFSRKEYLEAYAARWSPSRALCYLSVLVDIQEHLTELVLTENGAMGDQLDSKTLNVACIGGGAAEVVAFGGLLRHLCTAGNRVPEPDDILPAAKAVTDRFWSDLTIKLQLIDTAAWRDIVDALYNHLATPPPVSKYASSSAKSANSSLIAAKKMIPAFDQINVHSMTQEEVAGLTGQWPILITFLFTLNELYTESRAKTTALLLNLTSSLKTGSLLLVVDSPGSYSETTIGTEAKKYPMKWLLDHTLLEAHSSKREDDPKWVKILSDDARWFRVPESLRYPIPLENMRTQVHFYRRA